MRHLMVIFLILVFLGSAFALDTGNRPVTIKDLSHGGGDQGQPDGREGGETFNDAIVIPSIPFTDTGNTSDNIDDYDAVCPYSGSTAPDVVYKFIPHFDMVASIDLCGSGYDTKTYILDATMDLIACNDDYYTGDPCGQYVSFIEDAYLYAWNTYYIVIDGYGTESGDYVLNVTEYTPPPPCIIECSGVNEGEPATSPGYVDLYNSGCNDDTGLHPFQNLMGDGIGELTFCGKGGWNDAGKDTDWFIITIGEMGLVEWTVDTEIESWAFLLGPQDCATVGVVEQLTVLPCEPQTMTIQGNPGDIVWVWMGAALYAPPVGHVGLEFDYSLNFIGLDAGVVATDNVSFGGLKSLFR